MTFEELRLKNAAEYADILQIEGVHAVGIGMNDAGEYVRSIYVHNPELVANIQNTLLEDSEIIFEAEPVSDVLRFPKNLVTKLSALSDDEGRYRPVLGGVQIYLEDDNDAWVGTLSCFVKSQDKQDDYIYMLSNHHVFDSEALLVYQPLGSNDNIVGIVTDVTHGDHLDSALAKVLTPDYKVGVAEEIGKLTEIRTVIKADLGKTVKKRGRTTGLTYGTIKSIDCYVKIKRSNGGYRIVEHAIKITVDEERSRYYSMSGDSGSPVVFEDDNSLLGIHFAGNSIEHTYGYASNISQIFEDLNIELAIE